VKIGRVGFWHLKYPLERGYGDANGIKAHRTSIVIRIESTDGQVGWGETFGYRTNPQQWEDAARLIEGEDAAQVNLIVDKVARIDLSLAGGIDIALSDLKGKAAGLSLADMFGGAYRAAQPAYASLQNASNDKDAVGHAIAEATRAMELGFKSLKMKVGWHDVATDITWVNAVIDSLPEGVLLAIDANRAMDLPTARRMVRGIRRPERISWFEEPLANTQIEPHVELRNSIDIAVSGAESMPLATIERAIARRAMDIINPDLVGHGGFARLRRLWYAAEANGVRLVPHIFDGQLVRVATLHFLAAMPDWSEFQSAYRAAPLEYDISKNPTRDELLGTPLALDANGCVPVPTGPGLGVTVNEEIIRRFVIAQR
jgi:D-galactarolactone cycloisomerase